MRISRKFAGAAVAIIAAISMMSPAAGAASFAPRRTAPPSACHLAGPPGGPYVITCTPRPGGPTHR